MDELQSFIGNYLYLADVRNVSYDNPVVLELQPDNRTFLLVVSFTEPSFSQLPYNVLWICTNENDLWDKKLYRRVDHNKSEEVNHVGKRYTWEEVTNIGDLYSEDQYYQSVDETPASEIGASWANVGAASKEVGGMVLVNADPAEGDPIAITESDLRNTDKRNPTAHEHPDFPRTMTSLDGVYSADTRKADHVNDEKLFLSWDASQQPEAGNVFFLTGQNPLRLNEWYGEWRQPTQSDVWVDNAHITSVDVRIASGEVIVEDNSTITLGANSLYDDGTLIIDDTSTLWAIAPNSSDVTIHPTTGVLTIPDTNEDVVVEITATCSDIYWPSETAVGTISITIKDLYTARTITSLEITGADSMQEQTTEAYSVVVTYDDLTTATINPVTFTGNNPINAILTGGDLVANDISTDGTVLLSASYTENGITLNATKSVNIIADIVPVSVEILGSSVMNELTANTLQARVTYSDLTTSIVLVADSTWTFQEVYSNVDIDPGVDSITFTGNADITGNEMFTLNLSVNVDGYALTDQKEITVIDTTIPKVLQSLAILGSPTINEQTTGNFYTFEVTYTDATTAIVEADLGSWVTDNVVATNASTKTLGGNGGIITAELSGLTDILADEFVNVAASYTEGGVTINATLAITIVADPAIPLSLEILGVDSLKETLGSTYTFEVTFDDGSRQTVAVVDTASVAEAEADITTSGALTTVQVAADTAVTIVAQHLIDGVTLDATKTVTILDVPVFASSLVINGVTTVDENTAGTYTFTATYSDGTTADVTPLTFSSDVAAMSIVSSTSGTTMSQEVLVDTVAILSASYFEDGVTVNATLNVTVIDVVIPTNILINGASDLFENTSESYTYTLEFSDGSSRLITPDAQGTDIGTLVGGLFTAPVDVVGNQIANLTASFTEDGILVNGTLPVTVKDNVPVSISILGANSLLENTSENYTFNVSYTDGTVVSGVTPTTTNAEIGTFATNGLFTVGEVAVNTPVELSASFTENGTTVNGVKTVSVNDVVPITATGLAINGDSSLLENATATYTFTASYSDGSTADVTPLTSGSTTGTFTVGGLLTVGEVATDTVTSLTASYEFGGATVNGSKNVTIFDVPTLTGLDLSGPIVMGENGSTIDLVATATFSDGSTALVTAPSTYAIITGGAFATISSNVLTSGSVTGDENVLVRATYVYEGVTKTADHTVSITDTPLPVATGLVITGGTTVVESSAPVNLTATVSYDTAPDANVTVPSTWSITIGGGSGTISSSGSFTPGSVASDTDVTIQASYLENGVTVTDTHVITVTALPVPVSVAISGSTSIAENAGTIALSAVVSYSDLSTINETTDTGTVWSIQSGLGSITQGGIYTPPVDVASDSTVVVKVVHTKLGATVQDTHNITVTDVPVTAGYTPRWGSAGPGKSVPVPRLLSDYNEAFMEALTNPLTGISGESFTANGNVDTSKNGSGNSADHTHLYIAYPVALGWAKVIENGVNGQYDGATELYDEPFTEHTDFGGAVYVGDTLLFGGIHVVIGGEGYIIYRKDAGDSNPTVFNTVVEYGSASRISST